MAQNNNVDSSFQSHEWEIQVQCTYYAGVLYPTTCVSFLLH